MKVLVIGGSGFIGPHVVRRLQQQGHELAVFHRGSTPAPAGVTEFRGDRNRLDAQAEQLRAFRPDVVIDVILSSSRQAEQLISIFRGTVGRVVVVSSIDVYRAVGVLHGLEPGPLEPVPLTEESPLRTVFHPYPPESLKLLQKVFAWVDDAYDKIPVERAIRGAPGLTATIIRLPMVYGPGDPLHRFLPIVKRVDENRPAIIISEGMAQWRAARGYVENVAEAIVLAATADRAAGRVYHVADQENFSELEWTQVIAAAAGYRGKLVVLPDERTPKHLLLPGNTAQHWSADSTRIRQELGYIEKVPHEEAIRRTIAWERTHVPAGPLPYQFDYAAEDAALQSAHKN